MSIFKRDLSVNERRDITLLFKDLSKELTIFPKHIDALSDFTQKYPSVQILDDLHNVFLQTFFSFGLLVGLMFVYVSLRPFWIASLDRDERSGYLSIYTVYFVSLFVGISSPNYMYFGAVLIGLSLNFSNPKNQKSSGYTKQNSYFLLGVIALISLVPATIQTRDYIMRRDISDLTRSLQKPSGYQVYELSRLHKLIVTMPDAGFRYLVARNFYVVGKCEDGNRVLNLMIATNPKETRISKLFLLRAECSKSESNNE
jgi:hypothetical protein